MDSFTGLPVALAGHRALCPFASTIGLVSLTIARWPLCCAQLRHCSRATYTTRWDATRGGQERLVVVRGLGGIELAAGV
jgi:hypothetical protein